MWRHLTCLVAVCFASSAIALPIGPDNEPITKSFASDVTQQPEDTTYVVILLDSSGSMDNEMDEDTSRMDVAKQALQTVARELSGQTTVQVGLLTFDGWEYDIQQLNYIDFIEVVNSMRPNGGTPLGRFIKLAADVLLIRRGQERGYGTYRMIIVTDGEAEDPASVDNFTLDIMSRGIRLDVIGVAMAENHTLATKVHSYRSANSEGELTTALTEVLAEVTEETYNTKTTREWFDDISMLAPATAQAMIGALSHAAYANHPIGEEPPPQEVAEANVNTPHTNPSSADNTNDEKPGAINDSPVKVILIVLATAIAIILTIFGVAKIYY